MTMQKSVTYYTESYKFAFLAAIFLIGAVAIYRWFVIPHQNCLEAAQTYELVADNLTRKKQIINNNLKTKRIECKKLQERFSDVQAKLFDLPGEREYFSNIENLCSQAGCKMLSLTFSQSSLSDRRTVSESGEKPLVIASSAHLTVEGKYMNIVTMMNKLQDGRKLVRLDSVNMNTDNKNPGYLKCDMTITIYIANNLKELHND